MSEAAAFTRMTAREIARGVAGGRWSAEAVTRAFLDRCGAVDGRVRAWAALDPDHALEQARRIDRGDRNGRHKPLAGVPVGIKDILATADLPTEYGSPIYKGHRPRADAACVALARAAGAVILGKTATTEFAANNPTVTRNPCDLARSPGGSSSGSAAAVAAGMAALAVGTQTAGSVIRPASWCGVAACKPTFGHAPLAGLKPSANSLDTLGFFARNIRDAALFAAVASGRQPAADFDGPTPDPPRFALCRTAEWSAAESGTIEAVEACAEDIRAAGASVRDLTLPSGFAGLADAHWTVMAYETARSLTWEWTQHPDLCSEKLRAILELGAGIADAEYDRARALGSRCRRVLDAMLEGAGIDALLGPAAPGEAPEGLGSTGDPILNRVWTFLHMPCATLPLLAGPAGLPLGLQAIGRRGRDGQLLRAAAWLEDRLPARTALDRRIA